VSVEVRIGSLAVHGMDERAARQARSSLERELTRLIAADPGALPAESSSIGDVRGTLPGGDQALGAAAARAIHARLGA
jgi:hypothetical protein